MVDVKIQIYPSQNAEIILTVHIDKNQITTDINVIYKPSNSEIQQISTVHENLAYYIQAPLVVRPHATQSSSSFLDTEANPILIARWSIPNYWFPYTENTNLT